MKREFGSKLIEEFLAQQDLRLVVDTSGAYIPGHGTPTVIVVGRHQPPDRSDRSEPCSASAGSRGSQDPAKGLVWSSIVEHSDDAAFENEFITVTDLDRAVSGNHPWSLSGGGAPDVLHGAWKSSRAARRDASSHRIRHDASRVRTTSSCR